MDIANDDPNLEKMDDAMYNTLQGKTNDTHAAYKAAWSPSCTAAGAQGGLYGHDAKTGSDCLR